jgi:stress response protein YsnF
MSQTVIGIFENFSQAQDAKSHLLANGFTDAEVDITRKKAGDNDTDNDEGLGERISNFFKNLFSNEDEAASHTAAAKRGNLVTVHAGSLEQAELASDILNRYGAIDVDDYNKRYNDNLTGDRADSYRYSEDDDDDVRSGLRSSSIPGAGYAGAMTPTESLDTDNDRAGVVGKGDLRDSDATDKIKVIKEDLQVGKREVETGGVRLRSRIVERPVEESIRLREEHVNIERNTVDRPATEADFADFKEGTVEVTEYAGTTCCSEDCKGCGRGKS